MNKYITLKNLGWLLSIVVTLILGMGAISKITSSEEMVQNFSFFNMTSMMLPVGIVELLSVILLMVPRTSIFGAVGVSTMMSGAVAVHFAMLGGVGIFMPILLGTLAWSGHCLRTYNVNS